MNDITNIDEIIKTANVKSDFQGFIADVEFDDSQVYYAVASILNELKNKFTRINRPTEFVTFLKQSIIETFIQYNYKVYILQHPCIATNDNYDLNDVKILSYTTIGLILERTINKTNKFEDLEFKITPDDHSFDKLNQLIKEKRFSRFQENTCDDFTITLRVGLVHSTLTSLFHLTLDLKRQRSFALYRSPSRLEETLDTKLLTF